MGIGASLFLIAVGAILTFALNLHVAGVDIHVIGWILMVVGVLGLGITLAIWGGRRRTVVTSEPTTYRRVTTERDDLPPPPDY
jgi:hypothetical protein